MVVPSQFSMLCLSIGSLAYALTARALDKNLDYAFVSLKYKSVPLLTVTCTVSSSSQVEENSGQLSNAPKTSVCKVSAAQSYLDGGGAQARQCGYPLCANACTADACDAAAARITESAVTSCVKCAVRCLGIGVQQSAESSPRPALERSSSPASVQDWLPMDNHYASAPFLLNKCPIVIPTVDAASSPRTYVAGPITSISKLQIRPSISKIIFDLRYNLSIYSTSISKIRIFDIGYLRYSARYTKFELRYRIHLLPISKQSNLISNNFDI
jgi:hypothetical protein